MPKIPLIFGNRKLGIRSNTYYICKNQEWIMCLWRISLNNQPPGPYIIVFKTDDNMITQKVYKNIY